MCVLCAQQRRCRSRCKRCKRCKWRYGSAWAARFDKQPNNLLFAAGNYKQKRKKNDGSMQTVSTAVSKHASLVPLHSKGGRRVFTTHSVTRNSRRVHKLCRMVFASTSKRSYSATRALKRHHNFQLIDAFRQ